METHIITISTLNSLRCSSTLESIIRLNKAPERSYCVGTTLEILRSNKPGYFKIFMD